jgi:hypothetical protein
VKGDRRGRIKGTTVSRARARAQPHAQGGRLVSGQKEGWSGQREGMPGSLGRAIGREKGAIDRRRPADRVARQLERAEADLRDRAMPLVVERSTTAILKSHWSGERGARLASSASSGRCPRAGR